MFDDLSNKGFKKFIIKALGDTEDWERWRCLVETAKGLNNP